MGNLGLSEAARADVAAGDSGEHDVLRVHVRELFEHGARRVAEAGAALPHLKALAAHEDVKVNEDMRRDAIGMLVPDRAHARLVLLDPERRLGLSELDVGLSERMIAPIRDVGTQQMGRFRERGPLAESSVAGYPQAKAGRICGGHQRHLAAGGGALALLQDAADLPLHRCRIGAFVGAADTGGQAGERRFDPPAELPVDGPLFSPPVDRATEDHGLAGVGTARKRNLDAFLHRPPAAGGERGSEPPHLRLGRARHGAPATLAQPRRIGGAGHAAVGAPHPPQRSVPGLHGARDGRSLGWYEVFDPASGQYTMLANVPGSTPTQPFAGQRCHMGPVGAGDRIHAIGGRKNSYGYNTGLRAVYDPQGDRWGFCAPLPTPRSGIRCAYLAGRSLAFGGEAPGVVFAANEGYDPEGNRWETYAPITGGSVQGAYHDAFTLAD